MYCFTRKTLVSANLVRIHLLRAKTIVLRVKPFVLRINQKCYYILMFCFTRKVNGFTHKVSCFTRKDKCFTRKTLDKKQKSTVFTCFLDAAKAFDRVSHWTLFSKMIKRNVSLVIVRIIAY